MTLSKNVNRYISGIHNYCDKWCERCRLANQCVVYADTERKKIEHISKGEDPNDFNIVLQDVKQDFAKTMRLLKKVTEDKDVDLNQLQQKQDIFPDIRKYPLNIDSLDYMTQAHAFVKKTIRLLKAEKNDLAQRIKIMPSPEADLEQFEKILDHFEVVSWYLTIIPVTALSNGRDLTGNYSPLDLRYRPAGLS